MPPWRVFVPTLRPMTRPASRLLLILAATLLYLPGLTGGFAYDDFPNILDNASLRLQGFDRGALLDAAFSSTSGPLKRPLASLSFAAQYALGAGSAMSFKIVNLAIHACNALLVHALLLKILPRIAGARRTPALALATALLWAVHPINLTAVLYVVQRMASLSATFVLLGVLAYAGAREGMLAPVRRRPWPGFAACVLCGLLGIFTKESAALLPLFLLVLEATVWRFARVEILRALAWLGLAAALALAAWTLWTDPERFALAQGNRLFTPGQRLLTELRVLVFYLGQILCPLPSTLSLYHDDFTLSTGFLAPPTTLLSAALLGLLAAAAVLGRRRWPLFALGIGWFLAGHLLESTLVPLDLVYEHRNYVPAIGILLVAADALMHLAARLAFRPAFVIGALAVCFGAVTVVRAVQWSDPISLALAEARHNPDSQLTIYELGRIYHRLYEAEGDATFRARARAEFHRAIGMGPENYLPLTALVASYAHDGEAAPEAIRTALVRDLREGKPTEKRLYSIYALLECQRYRHCRTDADLAMAVTGAALENPQLSAVARARVLEWLGTYYCNVLGDLGAALRILREITAANPDLPEFRLAFVEALVLVKDYPQAAAELAKLPRPAGLWQRVSDRALRARTAAVAARLADATGARPQ